MNRFDLFPSAAIVQTMDASEGKRILHAARDLVTADRATVLQVRQHAQNLRPREFKLAGFEMLHSGTGKPTVGVCYWIGSKRLADNQYCDIGYAISADHKVLPPDVGTAIPEERAEMTVTKLGQGRDSFLKTVDARYDMDCVEYGTKRKSCLTQ